MAGDGRPLKAVCLAYPDLVVPGPIIDEIYGLGFAESLKTREDADSVRDWHHLPETFGPVYDTIAFLARCGIHADVIDAAMLWGVDRIVDLNDPLPADLFGKYQLVIDTGTLEHCFNVGGAFRNMCDMTALNGVILSMAPLSIVNHGFWNFSPTAFYDGFTQNGFKPLFLQARAKSVDSVSMYDFSKATDERISVAPETVIISAARRISSVPFKWPIQSKYKDLLSGEKGLETS